MSLPRKILHCLILAICLSFTLFDNVRAENREVTVREFKTSQGIFQILGCYGNRVLKVSDPCIPRETTDGFSLLHETIITPKGNAYSILPVETASEGWPLSFFKTLVEQGTGVYVILSRAVLKYNPQEDFSDEEAAELKLPTSIWGRFYQVFALAIEPRDFPFMIDAAVVRSNDKAFPLFDEIGSGQFSGIMTFEESSQQWKVIRFPVPGVYLAKTPYQRGHQRIVIPIQAHPLIKGNVYFELSTSSFHYQLLK